MAEICANGVTNGSISKVSRFVLDYKYSTNSEMGTDYPIFHTGRRPVLYCEVMSLLLFNKLHDINLFEAEIKSRTT